jgi:hypothetical protein
MAIVDHMAYDEDLAHRIRAIIGTAPGVTEKRMFGGLAFLVGGNMAVSASGHGGLMVRVLPDETDDLVDRPNAGPVIMRGREMRGWLRVTGDGVEDDAELAEWVRIGVDAARSLPEK